MKTHADKIAWIKTRLSEGRTVLISTATRQTRYTAKHLDWFKALPGGAFVQQGNKSVCINYCHISAI